MCSKRVNLPPGSKSVRLCLTCQALENMSTSGVIVGRTHLSQEEIYHTCKIQ